MQSMWGGDPQRKADLYRLQVCFRSGEEIRKGPPIEKRQGGKTFN